MILEDFLPVSKQDLERLEWSYCDFIIVTGDAYVDHSSFGAAVIGRTLIDAGYKVGIIPQPDWKNKESIEVLGKPRLGFLVTAGNLDSMVNHYYVSKKRRKFDSFSPNNINDKRPDRATIVYSNLIKQSYKDVPIILGGIEASLRRFAHYDYWADDVRRSILFDSGADLLIYGMGERPVKEVAEYLNSGIEAKYIQHIPGTCYLTDDAPYGDEFIFTESFETVSEDKKAFAKAFNDMYNEQDPITGKAVVQQHKNRFLVQNPPSLPLSREELDWSFGLGYMRNYHPMYESQGGVSAIDEVKKSVISERGCFGSCSFCSLAFHQGRIVTSRSEESILSEVDEIIKDKDFKGYINDVGGATANFRKPACKKQLRLGSCKHRQCLFPKPCPNLDIDHKEYLDILKKIKEKPEVKKVFIRSGIRYDYVMADNDQQKIMKQICEDHVSGQLRIAPEHIDPKVLSYMGKPTKDVYESFVKLFKTTNDKIKKEQYVVPYLMSSHPGSTLDSAIMMAEYLKKVGHIPEQVQDFYPTPGTMSTCMYYTDIDPRTMEHVYVAKSKEEKAMQRALIQFNRKENYHLVKKALIKAGRQDLIGFHNKALIRPERSNSKGNTGSHYKFNKKSKNR